MVQSHSYLRQACEAKISDGRLRTNDWEKRQKGIECDDYRVAGLSKDASKTVQLDFSRRNLMSDIIHAELELSYRESVKSLDFHVTGKCPLFNGSL